MDRLRHLKTAACAALLLLSSSCEDQKKTAPAPGRFAAVKAERATTATSTFCEKSFPASGPGARRFPAPPTRALPAGTPAQPAAEGKGWTWLNLWATWCAPCMAEMGLLSRWEKALKDDGVDVRLSLLTVDADEEPLVPVLQKGMPGPVSWLRSQDDLGALMESLGVPAATPIPVHALIDGAGNLRCVRVGAVHEGDYGSVKALLAGG